MGARDLVAIRWSPYSPPHGAVFIPPLARGDRAIKRAGNVSRASSLPQRAEAEHIERGLGGAVADDLPGADVVAFVHLAAAGIGDADIDQADRLLRGATLRPGDARNADAIVRAEAAARALCQRLREDRADRAHTGDHLRRHADKRRLGGVAVGDHP